VRYVSANTPPALLSNEDWSATEAATEAAAAAAADAADDEEPKPPRTRISPAAG
jgi:hypothetical protein